MTPRRSLTDDERLDWLRLFRSENVGPITFHKLLLRFGSAAEAIRNAPDLARRGGSKKPFVIQSRDEAARELEKLNKKGGFMLASCEPDYPDLLAEVADAPPVIAVLGQRKLLNSGRKVALVGARNASLNGKQLTERLARDCGQAGLTVVSGLARGIDTAAHKGSLETGTLAVVAGGIDVIYPEENQKLYESIIENGAIIAESPFGTPPTSHHFPKRNRIISGLSEAVLIVEAVQHSGSLITARMALEQGREVMAVPGSPLDPRCKGNNNLLREGATLVENVQDILGGLSTHPPARMAEPGGLFENRNESLSEGDIALAREKILSVLGPTPVRLDDLIREVELSASAVLAALLELELAGKAERQPGGTVSLLT
jgi:DNA processing protein